MYQNAALQALATIKNRAAYGVLKDILLQNPAIFDNSFEYQSLFRSIGDSMALAASLYPDLLQLTAFDDYKQPVINLLTKLVDSNYVKAETYAGQFSKLFFDAQVQTKKLQLSAERELVRSQAEQDRTDIFNTAGANNPVNNLLGSYLSLLAPFYDQNPQVAKFFTRLLQSSDIQARMLTALALAKIDKQVPDSTWNLIAASDQYRFVLYERLDKMKKLQLFPAAYKNQEAISRSMMVNSRGFMRASEIQPMGRKYVETKKAKGYVYLFKYRLQKQGDWLIGMAGVQPLDSTQISLDRSIVNMNNKKLLTNGTEQEQYDKMVKQLVISKRKSAATFYTQQTIFDSKTWDYNPFTLLSSLCLAASLAFTPFNHSCFSTLNTMLSRRSLLLYLGIWLRNTPSTTQPMLFMAAILLALLLSARNSTLSIPMVSKANCSNRYLQCLFRPVPWNFFPYQV
jgi:hypothetical protein